jgi:hypothetical protein
MAEQQTVPVSTRALVRRINRKLVPQGYFLRAARGARARQELGDYYVVEMQYGGTWPTHVDLEDLGREEGALKEWERWDQSED